MMQLAITGATAGTMTALLCWFLLRNALHSDQQKNKILQLFQDEIANSGNLERGDFTNSVKTDILQLFDDFMANKLIQKMPVLNIFIDEKLIAEIRVVFHDEMELQLPALLQTHFSGAESLKIVNSAIQKVISTQRKQAGGYLLKFVAGGAILGFVVGGLAGLIS